MGQKGAGGHSIRERSRPLALRPFEAEVALLEKEAAKAEEIEKAEPASETSDGYGTLELYAGTSNVKDVAPGKLGNQHKLEGVMTDRFTVKVEGTPINVVAHAVVCGQ